MSGLVYDTGALLAAERRDRFMWSLHDEALGRDVVPVVPVVVLAQAWRGGSQAELSLLLRGCQIQPDDEPMGRSAGRACGLSGTTDVVDAIVVVIATQRTAGVVSSDPDDLRRIADGLGVRLRIQRV